MRLSSRKEIILSLTFWWGIWKFSYFSKWSYHISASARTGKSNAASARKGASCSELTQFAYCREPASRPGSVCESYALYKLTESSSENNGIQVHHVLFLAMHFTRIVLGAIVWLGLLSFYVVEGERLEGIAWWSYARMKGYQLHSCWTWIIDKNWREVLNVGNSKYGMAM